MEFPEDLRKSEIQIRNPDNSSKPCYLESRCLAPKPVQSLKKFDQNLNSYKESLKLRQYLSNRTDSNPALELKSPVLKRSHDLSIPVSSKVPFLPLLSIRTNVLEEVFNEIKDLKNLISDSEEKSKVNSQCIEINKVKISQLEERHSKLLARAGGSGADRREELILKLKLMVISWKRNCDLLRRNVEELEEQVRNLDERRETIKGILAKKEIKNEWFKKKLDDSGSTVDSGLRA